MSIKNNRAYKAGKELGKAIIEMVHLMYQNRTAQIFIEALLVEINIEYDRRKSIK